LERHSHSVGKAIAAQYEFASGTMALLLRPAPLEQFCQGTMALLLRAVPLEQFWQ